jgi:hypothetical protein
MLLFYPILVELILFDRDVEKIRENYDRTYPDLMVDAYVELKSLEHLLRKPENPLDPSRSTVPHQ